MTTRTVTETITTQLPLVNLTGAIDAIRTSPLLNDVARAAFADWETLPCDPESLALLVFTVTDPLYIHYRTDRAVLRQLHALRAPFNPYITPQMQWSFEVASLEQPIIELTGEMIARVRETTSRLEIDFNELRDWHARLVGGDTGQVSRVEALRHQLNQLQMDYEQQGKNAAFIGEKIEREQKELKKL